MSLLNLTKKRVTPRDLRQKQGKLTTTTIPNSQLIEGAKRQWNRYNNPEFQREEFQNKVHKTFGQ